MVSIIQKFKVRKVQEFRKKHSLKHFKLQKNKR